MTPRTRTESGPEVSAQISPDRLSTLEAQVAQLRADLDAERYTNITVEGVVRDLGRKMIELVEIHQATVIELGRLTEHVVRHDETYRLSDAGAIFCRYCYPKEGTRS